MRRQGLVDDPWKLYAPAAPDWINDLAQLEYDEDYSIYATRNISLLARPPEARLNRAILTNVPAATLRLPPTTFYGTIGSGDGFTAAAGQQVAAYVGGTLCGRGQTKQVGSQVVYSIAVESVSPNLPNCGAVGRSVTFVIAGQSMSAREPWDNTRLAQIDLLPVQPSPDVRLVYLPLLRR